MLSVLALASSISLVSLPSDQRRFLEAVQAAEVRAARARTYYVPLVRKRYPPLPPRRPFDLPSRKP